MKPKPFKEAKVYMSRNLVAPEIFDALLDALKLNGAEVELCCDRSLQINPPLDTVKISKQKLS